MHLQNGCYYRNAQGQVVKCQLQQDGYFHIYDVNAQPIEKIPASTEYTEGRHEPTHVEGWEPIGRGEFDEERKKQENREAKKKAAKRKRKAKAAADKEADTEKVVEINNDEGTQPA